MSVSARVCCSRSCSAREGPAAGLMSRLVTARKERLTNSVMPKIAKRRSAIGRADSLRKGRMLDISDWSGEYNIELAGVLAPHALRREEPFKKGAANGNIQEISFSDGGRSFRDALDRCRGWWSRSVSEAAVTHASRRRRAQFQSDSKRKVSDENTTGGKPERHQKGHREAVRSGIATEGAGGEDRRDGRAFPGDGQEGGRNRETGPPD